MEWEAVLGPGSYRVQLVKVVPDNGQMTSQQSPRVSFQKEDGVWN